VDVSEEPVLVGVDGSRSSLRAAAWAVSLARARRTHLVCLFVHEAVPGLGGIVPDAQNQVQDASRAIASSLEAAVAERAQALGIRILFTEGAGDPPKQLRQIAVEIGAAAIVVGASDSPAHRIAGSVAARLIRKAPCPVVVVP
jgi:nucleotide-binding universal stress UspA family protein